MTDNRTTELLPCPFCGGEAQIVEGMYSSFQEGYAVRCCHCALTLGASGRLGECYEWSCSFTTEAEAITAWNTRTAHGTLTAEQVREAIFNGSSYASYDGAKYYADGIGMQSIADELNAELGSGTCVVTHDFKCSNCGKQIGVVRNCEMYETCDGQQAWKSLDHEVCDIPNFCPNCGAKVVG